MHSAKIVFYGLKPIRQKSLDHLSTWHDISIFDRERGQFVSIFRTLHRSILVFFILVVVSIVTLAHFSVAKIVAEQSRAQQQSISPALQLITEQLLKPLHIAQTLAKSTEIRDLMAATSFNQEKTLATLQRLQHEFGMLFFIASEQHRQQINSDGSRVELKEDKVNWYFKYRDAEAVAIADIGKWEDTHFYIDLKVFDQQGQFLGFFGTGQPLSYFLQLFNQYKEIYGYDFIFVDQHKNITLSSDPQLVAADSKFSNLADLSWYQSVAAHVMTTGSINNQLISQQGRDYLVAEVNIAPFDWTLYLLSPLDQRQHDISQGFILSIVILLIVIFALFLLIYNLLYYFKRDMQRHVNVDPLTLLANRNNIELSYEEIQAKGSVLSVVLVDIDHLRNVNDSYGHNIGDTVLKNVAHYLQGQMQDKAILGRWSSEEFIMLMPDTGPHEAYDLAQGMRKGLAQMKLCKGKPEVKVTASFGVSFSAVPRPLSEVVAHADDALYQAKRDGCNVVRMQLIESA